MAMIATASKNGQKGVRLITAGHFVASGQMQVIDNSGATIEISDGPRACVRLRL